MKTHNILNFLIQHFNYESYLELGHGMGYNFNEINIKNKISVDIRAHNSNNPPTVNTDTDSFFAKNKNTFDLIFVDASHSEDGSRKDILNSINSLNPKGSILCHDINPEKEEHQTPYYKGGHWNGQVWKTWVKLKSTRSDLNMIGVDTHFGCGFIQKGSQDTIPIPDELDWSYWDNNRGKYLIRTTEFVQKILEYT